ncbi:MAG TPA: glycosyltransferase family 4 protein [Chthoniobacteraceae bacterium]|nr:glycosyltransferase family 4 protein [Chthoniobacteraceae bacterium]
MLKERTGTEMATRDLALGFKKAGHEAIVYSPELGEIAEEIARAGIMVTDNLEKLDRVPDVIQGHHHAETVDALLRFPKTPAVFVVHDPAAWHSAPPATPQIRRHVAVDCNCHARLVEQCGVPGEMVRIIYNGFDPERFPRRQQPLHTISRALVFSNYAQPGGFVESIREACAELDISLDIVGSGMNTTHPDPGEILHRYDLVFGIGRCAVEASATGAAVITCGSPGLGPFTNLDNLYKLFGRDYPYVPFTKERVIAEIKKINPAEASALTDHIRETRRLPAIVNMYLALHAGVAAEAVPKAASKLGKQLLATARRLKKESGPQQQPEIGPGLNFLQRISPKLAVRILDAPATVTGTFTADVELENSSADIFGPGQSHPVNISYRWVSPEGRIVVFEGRRTPLQAPLKEGEKQHYRIRVDAPWQCGKYRLRVTLVQEQVAWLDALNPPVAAETEVVVNKPAAA